MKHSIKHYLGVKAPIKKVFESLTTTTGIQAWWTECPTYTCEIGGRVDFIFKGNGYHNVMKVTQLNESTLVEWTVLEGDKQWVGTNIRFELEEKEDATYIRFSHNLWEEQNDFFGHCSFHWGKYLMSLKNLCETEKGDPYTDY